MKLKQFTLTFSLCLCASSFLLAAQASDKDTPSAKENHAQAEDTRFIISAEIRERGVYSHGYKQLLALDQQGSFFVGQRTRLNFDFQKGPLGFFVQIEDGRIWGETNGSHSQGLGVSQAYFHMDIGK